MEYFIGIVMYFIVLHVRICFSSFVLSYEQVRTDYSRTSIRTDFFAEEKNWFSQERKAAYSYSAHDIEKSFIESPIDRETESVFFSLWNSKRNYMINLIDST